MKKTIFIALILLFSKSIFADAIIFNLSDKNNLQVNYKVCVGTAAGLACDSAYKALIINSNNDNDNKNYSVIKPSSTIKKDTVELIKIISAFEKDDKGNMVAKSTYKFEDSCIVMSAHGNDTSPTLNAIFFNDMKGSPYINCQLNHYGDSLGELA